MASRIVFTGPTYAHCPKCGHALVSPGFVFSPELRTVAMTHRDMSSCVDAALTFHVPLQRVECEVDGDHSRLRPTKFLG